ncbi:MAG TPA: exodeoxyribonuclease VII large subunit [Gemmatimonadaceae bacterium]|jgi:exodeoxyribonuclease VII large subunit|nr:exodeoxyribonuclease VII large subunit [Gemmatimonadaceae bacterium]
MKAVPFDLFASVLGRAGIGFTPEMPASVSDVALETRALVESGLHPLWVRGEITDFKRHRNGHWYFCLRDATAQIRCVVWSRDQRGLPAPPDDGMQVIVYGQMTVYTARADLQLKITRIEAQGDGLWRKAMALTLTKLRREGLLDENRKRPIPQFPSRVAIVTSPDGAAIRDIVAVFRERNSGVQLVICPAKVQGDGAATEIAAAIRRVSRWAGAEVVIVGRGGGGKDDLWAFNDERVARAVAACPVPVISAVGHEVDITVCDAVADLRAPTPSAAAAAACVAREEIEKAFALARRDLAVAMAARLRNTKLDLDRLRRSIARATQRVVADNKTALTTAAAQLNALSPLATLARGYAVARDRDGRALTSARQFKAGKDFELLLRDGAIKAITTSTE